MSSVSGKPALPLHVSFYGDQSAPTLPSRVCFQTHLMALAGQGASSQDANGEGWTVPGQLSEPCLKGKEKILEIWLSDKVSLDWRKGELKLFTLKVNLGRKKKKQVHGKVNQQSRKTFLFLGTGDLA